jgi:hypothetical protein
MWYITNASENQIDMMLADVRDIAQQFYVDMNTIQEESYREHKVVDPAIIVVGQKNQSTLGRLIGKLEAAKEMLSGVNHSAAPILTGE